MLGNIVTYVYQCFQFNVINTSTTYIIQIMKQIGLYYVHIALSLVSNENVMKFFHW